MYQKIEHDFKEKSTYRKTQLSYVYAFIIFWVLFILAAFGIVYNFNIDKLIDVSLTDLGYVALAEVISTIIFEITIYSYMVFKTRKNESFSIKKALSDHNKIIDLFWDQIYNKDVNIIIEILKRYSINTRPKTLEAVRHYQALIPRRTENPLQIISALALATSLVALILNDKIISSDFLGIAFIVFIFIIVCYIAFWHTNKTLLKMFGKTELYKRLELALSEIYMRSLIK